MAKALSYLNQRDFDKATELLKSFAKKEKELKATAATNLSFLNFLEGALGDAESHARLAMAADRYNAAPLVNMGNCLFTRGDYDNARAAYMEVRGGGGGIVGASPGPLRFSRYNGGAEGAGGPPPGSPAYFLPSRLPHPPPPPFCRPSALSPTAWRPSTTWASPPRGWATMTPRCTRSKSCTR